MAQGTSSFFVDERTILKPVPQRRSKLTNVQEVFPTPNDGDLISVNGDALESLDSLTAECGSPKQTPLDVSPTLPPFRRWSQGSLQVATVDEASALRSQPSPSSQGNISPLGSSLVKVAAKLLSSAPFSTITGTLAFLSPKYLSLLAVSIFIGTSPSLPTPSNASSSNYHGVPYQTIYLGVLLAALWILDEIYPGFSGLDPGFAVSALAALIGKTWSAWSNFLSSAGPNIHRQRPSYTSYDCNIEVATRPQRVGTPEMNGMCGFALG